MASSGTRAPPPAPSHGAFILAQVRSGLAHLRTTHSIDKQTYDQIEKLLATAEVREGDGTGSGGEAAKGSESETEEQRLGKRNAWLRDALAETSLLPTLVDTAMQVAVPSAILGSMQREAIVQLVERSQKAIARAVTDPKQQQRVGSGAWSGAKGAHTGLTKARNIAGQGLQEIAQKRQEARQRSEEKQREKREKKALKKELKREREEIIRKRQAEMAGNDAGGKPDRVLSGSSSGDFVHSPSTLTTTMSKASSHDLINRKDANTDDSDDDDDTDSDAEGDAGLHAEGGAMATVACGRIDDEDGGVGVTTTFSPWPGLLLCSTIVAISDEPIGSAKDIDWTRNEQARQNAESQSPTQQRRTLPPPPLPPPTRPADSSIVAPTQPVSTPTHQPSQTNQPPPPPPQQSSSGSAARGSSIIPQTSLQAPPPPPPTSIDRTEVRDVTEAKQKSWTKKLGL